VKANFLSFLSGLYYPGPGISIVEFKSFLGLIPIDMPGCSITYSFYLLFSLTLDGSSYAVGPGAIVLLRFINVRDAILYHVETTLSLRPLRVFLLVNQGSFIGTRACIHKSAIVCLRIYSNIMRGIK